MKKFKIYITELIDLFKLSINIDPYDAAIFTWFVIVIGVIMILGWFIFSHIRLVLI